MLNITVGPKSDLIAELVLIEDVEHYLSKSTSNLVQTLSWVFLAMILVCNGTLIKFIFKKESKLTDLDTMMFLDSVLCICIYISIMIVNIFGAAYILFVVVFCSYCKVFLSKGIVVYRYVFVVKNSWIKNTRWGVLLISLSTITIFSL